MYYYFNKINNLNSTVMISESKDIGICTCDLTSNTCDYRCCCDKNCPSFITNIWEINNECLNKSI